VKKNVAGQHVTCQLNTPAGVAFIGVALVVVSGNGGAQAVGLGAAPVDLGHGAFDYLPTQAETNYDHVAFTFYDALAAAVPQTVAVDPVAVQSGTGSIAWLYTLTDSISALPIADADVWVTSDIGGVNLLASGKTNSFGVVSFNLDAGTVYVWRFRTGYNFVNPDTEVVA
jgi:hypothetical protein